LNTARIFIPRKVEPQKEPVKVPKKPSQVFSGTVVYLCPYCNFNVGAAYIKQCTNCGLRFKNAQRVVFKQSLTPAQVRNVLDDPLQPGQRPFLGPSGKKILRYQKEDLDEVIDFLIKS